MAAHGANGAQPRPVAYDDRMPSKKRPVVNRQLVTLIGGPCHGTTLMMAAGRRWHAHALFSNEPGKIPSSKTYTVHQYAIDHDGIWRHIDGTHPLYID